MSLPYLAERREKMSVPKLLVLGSCNMDYTFGGPRFPSEGETVIGDTFSTAPGGKGANQACQAARAGASVDFIGKTGEDENGKTLREILSGMGIDTSMMLSDPGETTGCALIELERSEGTTKNRIMVVPGAQMHINPAELEFLDDRIKIYDMLILQLEINMEANRQAVRAAHMAGVPVMMNPAPYAAIDSETLNMLTFISPNEHEAREMTGIAINDLESAGRAAEAICRMGPRNVIITLGENGAVFYDGQNLIHCPCVRTEAVDPTAAGDSFVGAFCTAYSAGMKAEEAMCFASHAASITVSGRGAQPSIPDIKRIAESLRRAGELTGNEVVRQLLAD